MNKGDCIAVLVVGIFIGMALMIIGLLINA